MVQDAAAVVDEYFPASQSVHAKMVPPLPLFPAAQSAHDLSIVALQAAV